MPSSSFRRPRAVRDSSLLLSLQLLARSVRSSLFALFGAGFCLGREDEEEVVPASPAALRVPWTDDLSILVNDLVGGGVARAADDEGGLPVPLASSEGREGAPEGIWRSEKYSTETSRDHVSTRRGSDDR